MSNIHDLNNYSGNAGNVGIQNSMNSSSNSGRDDTLFVRSLYKLRSVTAVLLILNIAIYLFIIIIKNY